MSALLHPPSPPGQPAPLSAADVTDQASSGSSIHQRLGRTVGDFSRLLSGSFRRIDPKDADRSPLAQAARYAGKHLGLKPAELERADGEASGAFLERFATASGARVRPVGLENFAALEGEGPIVGFAADGRPLVLLPARLSGTHILDPVSNRSVPPAELAVGQTGYALHRVLPATRLTYRSLLGFGLGGCVPSLCAVIGFGALNSLLGLATPVGFAFVASHVVPTDDVMLLIQICAALLVAMVIQTGIHLAGQFSQAQVEGRAGLALHAAMVDRVLRLAPAYLGQSSTAILATQTETVDKFRRSLLNYAIAFTTAAISGIAAAALMCFYAPVAGLVAIAAAVTLLLLTGLFGWLQFRAIYEGERMDVVVLTFVYDLIRLVPVLQAQRAERAAFIHWAQNFLAFQSRTMRSGRIGNILQALEGGWEVLTLGLTFAAVAMVGVRSGSEALATGMAVAFVITLGKLNAATLAAAHALGGMTKLLPMAKLARSLIDQTVLPQVGGSAVPPLKGAIEFVDVGFAYDRRPVLTDVSLRVDPGEFIGISGPSGGGKSTLLRLFLGLEQPQSGRILLDDLDTAGLDRSGLAHQIGVVMQNGQPMSGTIYENIRGSTSISLNEAEDLAAQVGLAQDLDAMPMGLQTLVGAGGAGLSRGQAQRILIARALAVRPRILVMDEPAGPLQGSEQAVLLGLLASLDITRIVVSHDLALLAPADRLLELRDGRLIAMRTGDEKA